MIIEIGLLMLAIPIGYLIAWMARDELVSGRKWFRALIILGVIIGGWFYLVGNNAIALTGVFISIVSFVSYWKSFDDGK